MSAEGKKPEFLLYVCAMFVAICKSKAMCWTGKRQVRNCQTLGLINEWRSHEDNLTASKLSSHLGAADGDHDRRGNE